MRFCEENQYKILFCIICGMNHTVGGGWVTSLSSPFWVYLGSGGGKISEVELTCMKNYFIINNDDDFESSSTIELTSIVF